MQRTGRDNYHKWTQIFCKAANCSWSSVYCVIILCVFLLPHVYCFYCVCIAVLHTVVTGLLASSQYPEGPATGHHHTGFSRFPCVYKQMLRRFPSLQVATTCFSCSPPDLNFLDPYFMFMCMHNNHCHRVTAHLQLNILLLLLYFILHNVRTIKYVSFLKQ